MRKEAGFACVDRNWFPKQKWALSLKTASIWLSATGAAFVACCLVMLQFGDGMNSPVLVYPFMAVWGLSALAWPLFAIWTFKLAVASLWTPPGMRGRTGP